MYFYYHFNVIMLLLLSVEHILIFILKSPWLHECVFPPPPIIKHYFFFRFSWVLEVYNLSAGRDLMDLPGQSLSWGNWDPKNLLKVTGLLHGRNQHIYQYIPEIFQLHKMCFNVQNVNKESSTRIIFFSPYFPSYISSL